VAALRRHPELRGEAVIVGDAPELRRPVIAASAAAAAAGVAPGQPLRQAQQLCPQAAFVSVDGEDVERLRAGVATALGGLSPAIEVAEEESCCDLSGSHAAFTDEGRWAAAIARALMETLDGELPAIGVGSSRFVARMAALASEPRRIRRIPAGGEAAFLAPLPLGMLPVDPAIGARLAALGLDCIGAVANLSPVELQRQFGAEGLVLHRHCHGEDGAGLAVDVGPRRAVERMVLDGAAADLEVLRFTAHRCAVDLGDSLRSRGFAAVALVLVLELEELPALRVEVHPPLPAGNAAELWSAVLALLGELRPQAPVSAIRLEAELRVAAARQADLWRGGDAEREQVLAAAARLQRRYSETALRRPRLAVDPGDLPERRFRWDAPVTAPAPATAHSSHGRVAEHDGSVVPAARSSTQPAQKGRVPWSRPAAARQPGRGHPRPGPAAAQAAMHASAGRTHV
jgi:nucleotidyltransferase/DNA polymerase involved in DNA repair